MRHSQFSTSVPGPNNQNQPMSEKHEPFHVVAASAPEPMGAVMGKVAVVWTGFFAGMTLGEWVLVATLVYTLLQITLLIVERIIKPILALWAARVAKVTPPKPDQSVDY